MIGCPSALKVAYCKKNGITILVDDHPVTQEAAVAAGITVFSFPYEYNRKIAGVTFVADWWELAALLDEQVRGIAVAAVS